MKFLNTTGNSIEMIDGDVVLNLPFNALYTYIKDNNISFLINYPSDVWDYDSLKQYRRVRPEYKYGDALMSANADQLNVNGNVYDIEQLKVLLPTLINKSGGGCYIEESYTASDYDYVLGEGNFLDYLRDESYAITSDWTEYSNRVQTINKLMYFIPNLPFNNNNISSFFKNCTNLLITPPLNFQNVEIMGTNGGGATYKSDGTFYNCKNLISITLNNTEKIIDLWGAFGECTSLKYINFNNTLNLPSARYISYAFENCSSLENITLLNTNNVTQTNYLFNGCKNLKKVSDLDFSKAEAFTNFFYNCENLTEIGNIIFPTSRTFSMIAMFYNCKSLKTIPHFDTSKANNINSAFYACSGLELIPKLNFSSVISTMTYTSSFLRGNSSSTATTNNYPNLTDLGGFTELKISFWLNGCQSLTEESIINVFNEMADLSATTSQTVHLGSVNIAKCSPETLAIATDKNWIIT